MDEDEYMRELLEQIAAVTQTPIEEVEIGISEAMTAYTKANIKPFMQTKGLKRPYLPAGIKRDIKHEKNPMRLKQLNKESNESYKAYKRK